MTAFSSPGVFGKIPERGDFVRVRAAEKAAQELVLWLEEGSESAKRAKVPMGPETVRFVVSSPSGGRVLAGAMAASADKVGRAFPLVLFASTDGAGLSTSYPLLPGASRPFLDGAAELVADAARLTTEELPARIDRLPPPDPDGALGSALRDGAMAAPASERLESLLGDAGSGQQLYALHCIRTACSGAREKKPGVAGVVLDCPARDDADRFAWLELVRRGLAWSGPPSFFWSENGQGRLLVALGAPPPGIFAAVWSPAHREPKLWPLTTTRPEAIEAARKALGPAVLDTLARPGTTLAELVGAVHP